MLIGLIHKGSGLGDQLFSYIATRVRAVDLGVDFGFVGKEFFKGASFMNLDWGKDTNHIDVFIKPESGELSVGQPYNFKEFKLNKPYYDPEFNFIPDGSVIDGYGAQDIRYFEHRLDEVREWVKTDQGAMIYQDELCVINFRGGEYVGIPELFLTREYWDKAVQLIKSKYPNVGFQVHTDDLETAKEFFIDYPEFFIIQGIEANWKAIRYTKHLIISNSAFAILPALLNENVKEVIAPRFWAGRNVGQWRRPGNHYKKFTYI